MHSFSGKITQSSRLLSIETNYHSVPLISCLLTLRMSVSAASSQLVAMFSAGLLLFAMVATLLIAEPALALTQFNGTVEGPAVVNTLGFHRLLRGCFISDTLF